MMEKPLADELPHGSEVAERTDPAFQERLREVLKQIGQDASVQASGKSWKTLSRYLAGHEPPLGVIVRLSKVAEVAIDWLITGVGPRDSAVQLRHFARTQGEQPGAPPMLQTANPNAQEASALVLIPRLDVQAAAGAGQVAVSEEPVDFVAFQESYLRDLGINPRFAKIIQVRGRSMYPTLDDREFVVIDISIDRVVDEAIYAVVYGGLVLIKRIRLGRDGAVTLSSDNKEGGYTDELIRPADVDDLHIVGRLKGHFRVL